MALGVERSGRCSNSLVDVSRGWRAAALTVVSPAPLKALASSIAFEYVYWSVAVRPLRRRRRNWIWPASRVESPFEVEIHETCGTRRARIRRAERISIGQRFLHQPRSLRAEVGRGHDQRTGQILLHGNVPVLRVADAEVGINSERIGLRSELC